MARFSIHINVIHFMAIYEDIKMTFQIRGKPCHYVHVRLVHEARKR